MSKVLYLVDYSVCIKIKPENTELHAPYFELHSFHLLNHIAGDISFIY